MLDRYFTHTPINGDHATLDGAEAHHLIHVMRAKAGTRVTLFDGSGAEFAAQVEKVGRSDVQLAILSRQEVDRELPLEVVLGVSLPKGDRQKWLVEKAVELGVDRIVPLITARSVAQPVQQALERLQRSVIEASKQCGRNRLMTLADPAEWNEFVAAAPASARRLLAHPGKPMAPLVPVSVELPKGQRPAVFLAIGPEGGFTADEVALAASHGWQTVDLGPRILRVETAAVFLVALAIQPPYASGSH
jgi:16S rRNA (uracil1498-N3)-methyltransferase